MNRGKQKKGRGRRKGTKEKEGRSRNKKSRSQRKNSNDDIIQDKSASKFDYFSSSLESCNINLNKIK